MKIIQCLASMGITALLLTTGIGSANAAPDDSLSDEQISSYQQSSELSPSIKAGGDGGKKDSIGTMSVPMSGNPYGCYGQTDYAHPHYPYASVHGRTKCNLNSPSTLSVTTDLRKLGWFGEWTSMASHSSSTSYKLTSNDAHPHWNCTGWGSQAYKGTSSHYARIGSTDYYAYTAGSEARFSC